MRSRSSVRHQRLAWVFGATSLVLAIVLTAIASGSLFKRTEATDGVQAAAGVRDIWWASASDAGPVVVVADDPTCPEWGRVSASLVGRQNSVAWFDRDGSIPAVEWSPEESAMYRAVAGALGGVAVRTRDLARATPHRVMREMYEQLGVYARDLINRIPQYQAGDVETARTTDALVGAITSICNAAMSGSARVQVSSPGAVGLPTHPLPADSDAVLRPLLERENPTCAEWLPMSTDYRSAIEDLGDADSSALSTGFADRAEGLGRRSNSPIAEDVLALSAQYLRAGALEPQSDGQRANAADALISVVDHVCAGPV